MSVTFLDRIGLTKGKAILIAILLLIFVSVVVSNLMPASSKPTVASKPRTATSDATGLKKNRRQSTRSAVNNRSRKPNDKRRLVNRAPLSWPKIELSDAIKHDPFALPIALQPEAKEQVIEQAAVEESNDEALKLERERLEIARLEQLRKRQQQLARLRELQKSGIGIALISPEAKIVKVGDKKLQVGDRLDGFRIVEIRPDGSVVVEVD